MIRICPAGARTTALFMQCLILLLRSWQAAVTSSKIRFTFQEYFQQYDGGSEALGQHRSQPCSVLTARSSASAFRPSAARTVCPAPSMMKSTEKSMYRRHWFPLQWMWPMTKHVIISGI